MTTSSACREGIVYGAFGHFAISRRKLRPYFTAAFHCFAFNRRKPRAYFTAGFAVLHLTAVNREGKHEEVADFFVIGFITHKA